MNLVLRGRPNMVWIVSRKFAIFEGERLLAKVFSTYESHG